MRQRTLASLAFVFAACTCSPAAAADGNDAAVISTSIAAAVDASAAAEATIGPAFRLPPPATRGASLPALYASLAGLQAFDAYTTMQGLSAGAREANPVMQGFAANPALLLGAKLAATGTSIFAAERLWRSGHRGQAIGLMIVTNGIMAAVAVRNGAVLRAQR